jgi:hypothetical protein
MHAQWKIILNDDFIEAWKHGIIVTCCDGVKRRFYIRIFTHSGDYPEKYAQASNFGFASSDACNNQQDPLSFPPQSRFLPVSSLSHPFESQRASLVRVDDKDRRYRIATARQFIYEKQYRVNSAAVERLLQEDSLVPTSVCLICPFAISVTDIFSLSRMHFQKDFHLWVSIYSTYLSLI